MVVGVVVVVASAVVVSAVPPVVLSGTALVVPSVASDGVTALVGLGAAEVVVVVSAVLSTGATGRVGAVSVVTGWAVVVVGVTAAGWIAGPPAPAGSRAERSLMLSWPTNFATAVVALLASSWAWSVSGAWCRRQRWMSYNALPSCRLCFER